ncbi:MAG: PIN domain-containing protein [Candidatus Omnitrophota bacterium]
MTVKFIRIFFLMLSVISGYYFWPLLMGAVSGGALVGAGIGMIGGLLLILVEVKLRSVSLRNLSAAAFGLIFGFFMVWMVTLILKLIPIDEVYYSTLQVIFTLIFCYLGMVIAIKGKDEFNIVIPYVKFSREDEHNKLFILDTSVIVDGRVTSICETGFLSGKLIVPRFVLQELHQLADSADDIKRSSGRRGLDMLDRLKKIDGVDVLIHDEGLSDVKGVDAKLVRLSKILDCEIITNDFNLSKVAKLEGVKTLSINELSGALRPVLLPGERINIIIKKEGKERNQGIAYLDDGTMIVVDNARRFIGKSVDVVVASVLQTSAGRMIFAAFSEKLDQRKPNNSSEDKKK